MTRPKTSHEKALTAEELASRYLAQFNELDERGLGNTPEAQKLYRKADFWQHRLNKNLGNG